MTKKPFAALERAAALAKRDAESVPLHDILLLLGYTPGPDECIGQATIHKAIRERDAEIERKARLDEAKWWQHEFDTGDNPYADDRIAALERAKPEGGE